MAKYKVKIKYGNPGEYKHDSQVMTVEAGSESMAAQLAVSQFKNSNSTYQNKDVDVIDIKES